MKEVGKDTNAPFCAYGDDSAYKDILVYAYAVFHRKDILRAENLLNEIKIKFKIPDNIPIHCRILFSGNQRQKFGLSSTTERKNKGL